MKINIIKVLNEIAAADATASVYAFAVAVTSGVVGFLSSLIAFVKAVFNEATVYGLPAFSAS